MKEIGSVCAIGLVASLLAFSPASQAGDDRDSHDRGDRILGLWSTEGLVGPCNGTPGQPIRNTLLFSDGGTVVENPRFPPSGVPVAPGSTSIYQRGSGLGTWVYESWRRRYYLHLQFDNYVDGVYHGYSTVDREITLSQHGMLATGPVRSARYLADGTLFSEVCGTATSKPL